MVVTRRAFNADGGDKADAPAKRGRCSDGGVVVGGATVPEAPTDHESNTVTLRDLALRDLAAGVADDCGNSASEVESAKNSGVCSVCKRACNDFQTCAQCSEVVCDECQVEESAIDYCDKCEEHTCQDCGTVAHCVECSTGMCEDCGEVDGDHVCGDCRGGGE